MQSNIFRDVNQALQNGNAILAEQGGAKQAATTCKMTARLSEGRRREHWIVVGE